ncbi:MAG TPA: hypothetical protein VK826_10815 [Bacteroidia bacterium]|nr:hypothetical protein [Bacteroidia bacterium]
MQLRNNICFVLLTWMTFAVFTSFVEYSNAPVDGCRFTYLRSSDFRSKTMEISNVFRVAPGYKNSDSRYRYTFYSDSAGAEVDRRNSILSARSSEYQVMLIHSADQCAK